MTQPNRLGKSRINLTRIIDSRVQQHLTGVQKVKAVRWWQALRDTPISSSGGGAGGGESGGGTPAFPDDIHLTVPNNSTVTYDFGPLASTGHVYGRHLQLRTVGGSPQSACGDFHLSHDGTNAIFSWSEANSCGIGASVSIVSGQLRLTLTDLAADGQPTTVRLSCERGLPL